jgi:cytidine deaminase
LTAGAAVENLTRMSAPEKTATKARSEADDELVARAVGVMAHAHSPYSNVRVGAALRAEDGRIFTGCNVENASFGMTLCAERTAVVKAVSEGVRTFTALAIATSLDRALMPCGACRQVLHEFAPTLRVIVLGANGERVQTTLAKLLPDAFGPQSLA